MPLNKQDKTNGILKYNAHTSLYEDEYRHHSYIIMIIVICHYFHCHKINRKVLHSMQKDITTINFFL